MRLEVMPLKNFTAVVVLFLLGVCAVTCGPASAAGDDSFEVVKTDEFEGVIVPGQKARDFMKGFSNADESDAWTPDRKSVLKLEEGIESYLKKAAAKRSLALWSKLVKYKRQYVGVMRNGRRVIFANFFCDSFDLDWKTKPVLVEDGGDCFFNLLYDPGSNVFSDLRVNGEA